MHDINQFIETATGMTQHRVHREMQEAMVSQKLIAFQGPPGIGKSTQVALRLLWEIGRNPDVRIRVVGSPCKSHGPALTMLEEVRNAMSHPWFRRVFPGVNVAENNKNMFFATRQAMLMEPTMVVTSLETLASECGSRLDWIVVDDAFTEADLANEAARDAAYARLQKAMRRLRPDGKVVVASQYTHPDDVVSRLTAQKGWTVLRWTAADAPETWPKERLDQARCQMTRADFYRLFYGVHGDGCRSDRARLCADLAAAAVAIAAGDSTAVDHAERIVEQLRA